MRLTKIAFNGYRRLVSTSCNVDSKLVAFLGPNEAGKSSLLHALEWWSTGGKIDSRDVARHHVLDSTDPVVSLTFIMDDDDISELNKRYLSAAPNTNFRVHRTSSGKRLVGFGPHLKRDWERLRELALGIAKDIRDLTPRDSSSGVGEVTLVKAQKLLQAVIRKKDMTAEEAEAVKLDPDEHLALSAQNPSLAIRLSDLHGLLRRTPFGLAQQSLVSRLPKIVFYKAEDRSLQTRYEISEIVPLDDAPESLVSLLTLAEVDIEALVRAVVANDTSRIKTILKGANTRLRRKLQPVWQQKQISLSLASEGDELLVLVDELDDDGSLTTIEERSDGLRAFLGMTCFVLAHRGASEGLPVILLADEMDRHLHFDAQADLVSVLVLQTEIQQVLYTTHSPGCLPPDLGTSVRLVEPVENDPDRSTIRSSFWGTSAIGFSPLLVAMGAGAAAFSACRKAVLAEGATEMILLPTLLRRATGLSQLQYQVAPGLSSLRRDGFGLDEISARVAYLIDGDEGGKAKAKLLSGLGVPSTVIVSLPEGETIEDLVDFRTYVDAVRVLLSDRQIDTGDFLVDELGARPLVDRVAEACTRIGVSAPGKTAIANLLIQDPTKIVLASEAEVTLTELHRKFSEILGC